MKIVFVRYTSEHEGKSTSGIQIISGDMAEDRDSCLRFLNKDGTAVITDWFEVTPEWKNVVGNEDLFNAFSELLDIELLEEKPVISELLATIFEAGYRLGAKLPQKT